ncbi:MAG: class I SAM-dependent methyltransferase [Bdellovibrionales bacterium]|nr:class I SAM-dependent methyltransferase [Bdellovibrionales bacterium]
MDKHNSNRQAWNEAANFYRKGLKESLEFLKGGGVSLCTQEIKFLSGLDKWCQTAVHFQCAAGTDTLSLINLGAKEVIGVDISEAMIGLARKKSERLGMKARWINSDILSLGNDLDMIADLVYTGQGAINWIMDIQAWAKLIFRTLKPGGRFLIFEGHPVTYFFDTAASELKFDPEFEGYFSRKIYESQGWTPAYVGDLEVSANQQSVKYERAWPISDIINALLDAGLTLKRFEEYPDAYWKEFPNLEETDRMKFPNTFCILMTR